MHKWLKGQDLKFQTECTSKSSISITSSVNLLLRLPYIQLIHLIHKAGAIESQHRTKSFSNKDETFFVSRDLSGTLSFSSCSALLCSVYAPLRNPITPLPTLRSLKSVGEQLKKDYSHVFASESLSLSLSLTKSHHIPCSRGVVGEQF